MAESQVQGLLDLPPLSVRLATRDVSVTATQRLSATIALGCTLGLFVLLFVILPESIRPPAPLTSASILGLLGVCLVCGLILGLWVWTEVSICRRFGPMSPWRFVVIYAAAGLAFGLTLELLLPLTGFVSVAPPVVWILSTTAVIPWMAAIFGVVIDGRKRVAAARALLVDRAADVILRGQSQLDLIADLRSRLHAEFESSLKQTFAITSRRLDVEAAFARDHVMATAADVLKDLTESSVRPFSHRLARSGGRSRNRLGVLAFITGVARHQSFRPGAVSGIFLLTVVADRWTTVGLRSAFLSAAIGVPLIILILGIGNRVMAAFPRHHSVLFTAFFLILQIPTLGVDLAAQGFSIAWLSQSLFAVAISGLIIWTTSGVGRWRTPGAELLRLYADELDSARIELLAHTEIIRAITRDAARHIHGSVQSRLTACIVSLERAAAAEDDVAFDDALAQARGILHAPWPQITEMPRQTLDVEVRDKIDLWQGLAGISVFVSPEVRHITGAPARLVSAVVEEGLCNAIRHGEADTVSVQVDIDGPNIRVRVVDDGLGPGFGSPGLGSTLLDEACGGQWSRTATPGGGCTLDARVRAPLSEPEPPAGRVRPATPDQREPAAPAP